MYINLPSTRPTRRSYPPICFDDEYFLISEADFRALPEYNTSRPSGVYHGKCWKCWKATQGGEWWIGCYVDDGNPAGYLTTMRRALICD